MDKVDLVHSYMVSIALACMQFNCLCSFIEFRECGLSTSLIQEFLNDHYSRKNSICFLIRYVINKGMNNRFYAVVISLYSNVSIVNKTSAKVEKT